MKSMVDITPIGVKFGTLPINTWECVKHVTIQEEEEVVNVSNQSKVAPNHRKSNRGYHDIGIDGRIRLFLH